MLISPYWREEHRWMVSSVKLAELWQRLGYKVVVACMGKGNGTRCMGHGTTVEDVSPTLRIYRMKDIFLKDPLNFGIAFGFAGLVRRLIQEEKPDHIVFNKVLFWTSFAAIPLRLRGYRFDVLTDALVGITWQPRSLIPKIIMSIGGWTVGWLVLLCARRVVTFHPQPPRILRLLGIAKKTQVIPTGIDPSGFGLRASDSEAQFSILNSQFPILNSQFSITYIGRLESIKGVDDFLAAAVPLQKTFPGLRIRVVGWCPPGNVLVERYSSTVEFMGLRSDIPEILSQTDIFVLPSHSEGLSNALMEAMASYCACIASDTGGNRFLIENGISGLLFPPGDREALRAHIRRLIEDSAKRRMLGQAARKRIEGQFSWDVVSRMYRNFFGDFLHSRS